MRRMYRNIQSHTTPPEPDGPDPLWDFSAFYKAYAPLLLAFLKSRYHSNAVDDLAQVIWFKIARSLETQFDGNDFRAWMFEIARNTLIDHLRGKAGRMLESLEWIDDRPDPQDQDPVESLIDQERMAAIWDCQDQLTDLERCVFRVRLAGASFEEITTNCGCDHNAAYKALNATKTKMRKCLERKNV